MGGEKVRAVFIHDYPILISSTDLQYNMCSENSIVSKWNIYHRPYLNCKEQADPYLIEAIKKSFLTEPSRDKDYQFDRPLAKQELNRQSELARDVDDMVFNNNLRDGLSTLIFMPSETTRRSPSPWAG